MEAALLNEEELGLFSNFLRLSHSYDTLQAWMWARVLNHLKVKDGKDESALDAQVKQLWKIYLCEDAEKPAPVEVENINEWGEHIAVSLELIESALLLELKKSWIEYNNSPPRKRLRGRVHRNRKSKEEHRAESPKIARRASETRLLHNSVEIRESYRCMVLAK